jgi:hypothetical protein
VTQSAASNYYTAPGNIVQLGVKFPARTEAAAAGAAASSTAASSSNGASDALYDAWGPFARQQQARQLQGAGGGGGSGVFDGVSPAGQAAQQPQPPQQQQLSGGGSEEQQAGDWEVLPVVMTPLKVPPHGGHGAQDDGSDTPPTPRTSVVRLACAVCCGGAWHA